MTEEQEQKLIELTPEQYTQGFVAPGGWSVPFGPILRKTEQGTIIVKEPTPVGRGK